MVITFKLKEYTELPKIKIILNEKREYLPKLFTYSPKDIPSIVCVYFYVNENNEIEYIGSTKNLKERIRVHYSTDKFRYKELYYLETDSLIEAQLYETIYICYYKPKLNIVFKNGLTKRYLKEPNKEESEYEEKEKAYILKKMIESIWGKKEPEEPAYIKKWRENYINQRRIKDF